MTKGRKERGCENIREEVNDPKRRVIKAPWNVGPFSPQCHNLRRT